VRRRALARDSDRHATDLGDLLAHLRPRQQPAEARLRALAELDLDRPHRRGPHRLDETIEIESPIGRAASEVPGADLPNEIASVPVVPRDAALAGGVERTCHRTAAIERLDRGTTQRSETHRRDVDHRIGTEGERSTM
jgi:hypothetical protein